MCSQRGFRFLIWNPVYCVCLCTCEHKLACVRHVLMFCRAIQLYSSAKLRHSALCGLTETKGPQCDTLKARLMRTVHNLKARTVAVHLLLFKSHCLVHRSSSSGNFLFVLSLCDFSASSQLFSTPATAISMFTAAAQAKCCIRKFTSTLFKKNALTSFIITTALQVLQSSHQLLHVFFTL